MLRARGPGPGAPLLRAALGLGRRGRSWQRPQGQDTGVQVHNSLTGRKEPLIVARSDAVSWYSCGPTVYDHAHLGHACSYVRFDIIRRILTRVFGCNVVMAMSITDVDDKIIKRANEMNVTPASLASLFEEEFKQDMAALKVLPPTVYLRVTENIPQIIAFIKGIIAHGHAYSTAAGSVYFDLHARGDKYGKLVNTVPSATAEPGDSDKRHSSDFALWKAAKPQEVFWASPWGDGRPGWHIECSTMASEVFGSHLDIHTGGIDLAFPHHENEIAQSEVFHQCQQWGNYFLHSGHLHVKGTEEKMSKSLKNYITIKDSLQDCRLSGRSLLDSCSHCCFDSIAEPSRGPKGKQDLPLRCDLHGGTTDPVHILHKGLLNSHPASFLEQGREHSLQVTPGLKRRRWLLENERPSEMKRL